MNFFQNFMEEVFRVLAVRNIDYLVLRNYESLPEETTNDVDILIAPPFVDKAKKAVLDAASETGWRLSNIGRFSCLSLFFFRPDTLQQTHIDLMIGIRWHSLIYADQHEMLASRQAIRGFFNPSPADEAWINLSTRLLYGGYVKETYRPMIQSVCSEQADSAKRVFGRFLGRGLANHVVSLCAKGRWEDIERMATHVRIRVLLENMKNPMAFASRLFHDVVRGVDRIRFPVGLNVGIVSANGEWRKRVADILMHNLKGTFSQERTFRWNLSTPPRNIRRVCWRNAFHGGLSILDLSCANKTGKICDILFSDSERSVDSSIVPPNGTQMGHFVIEIILRFLESRTRDRHER